MLSKREIMSVGTIVRIRYENDCKDTLAVIVGHLSLSKQMQCHYDYICVEYPFGIERGILYVNHSDILEKLHYFLDYDDIKEQVNNLMTTQVTRKKAKLDASVLLTGIFPCLLSKWPCPGP